MILPTRTGPSSWLDEITMRSPKTTPSVVVPLFAIQGTNRALS
jgi:hypothetical protein